MENKFTDNEIMKALEWLKRIERDTDVSEWAESIRIILDDYNRQKAEIERLNTEEKALLYTVEGMRKERTRMQTILVNFMDEVYEWGNKNNVDTNNFAQIAILGIERDSAVRQIKSEGRKEFAERLKEKATTAIIGQGKYSYEIITEQSIDNLVKEMEGEDGLN